MLAQKLNGPSALCEKLQEEGKDELSRAESSF